VIVLKHLEERLTFRGRHGVIGLHFRLHARLRFTTTMPLTTRIDPAIMFHVNGSLKR